MSHIYTMGNNDLSAASRIKAKIQASTESVPERKAQTGQKNKSKGHNHQLHPKDPLVFSLGLFQFLMWEFH